MLRLVVSIDSLLKQMAADVAFDVRGKLTYLDS